MAEVTVILRPNGDSPALAGGGGGAPDPDWVINGGAASRSAAISDASDLTFLSGIAANINTAYVFDFATVALPALALVRSITMYARIKVSNPADIDLVWGVLYHTGSSYYYWESPHQTPSSAVITAHTFGTITTAPVVGGPITQAIIDSLAGSIGFQSPLGAGSINIYDAWVEVRYNRAPVTTVTGPVEASNVVDTTRPTVTWTYADADGDVQERYRVKIFSAAQYGAGGFNPDTSAATWDSGEVFSGTLAQTVGMDLVNGTTYRAYVKSADAGTSGRYGAWDNNTFTIVVAAPPAPALVVTPQPANATGPRTRLDLVRTANATPTTWMSIEYLQNVNLLHEAQAQPSVDVGVGVFGVYANAGGLVTYAYPAANGEVVLLWTSVAAGNSGVETLNPNAPASAGQTYTARADLSSSTPALTGRISIRWFTAAGVLISESLGPLIALGADQYDFKEVSVTAVAPATTASARVTFQFVSTGAGQAAAVHHAILQQGSSLAWSPGSSKWALLRGAEHVVNNPDGTAFTFYDYEATPRVQRSYRATAVRTV